ncbi:MBL fold metallo-hydrolase [Kiloniella majae]|uniref:MBL fold metallo-hydrolase n=1 Tax=Kiloniella majae TaxID=1938558 RepID=UPI000A278B7F|nr:MBL fold metallo-hydrolase [Kiloniella majae]
MLRKIGGQLAGALQKTALVFSTVLALTQVSHAEGLKLQVFNPGEKSLFAVTSTLVTGKSEAVLIDAQFQKDDAQSVLAMIKQSGKKLTTIYISHSDPDFYFGLDVIKQAYPDARVIATPKTVEKIRASIDGKVAYWGPILKENAPDQVFVPDVITSDTIEVDGQKLIIQGLNGHDPVHTYLWIPSLKTVAGGVIVNENRHVWIADAQTRASRQNWFKTLDTIIDLNPKRVIPGHYVERAVQDLSSVRQTREYIVTFEKEASKAVDSKELIERMKQLYPDYTNFGSLEISAKVIKGEMTWPQ